MGRRSTKTTKTGKFMNPTDQWRKESRRKELKKNKKQRLAVREAVLKTKSAGVIIKEIEELEQQEVDAVQQPTEKSLKEKKRKLVETLERITTYYKKEDPEKYAEIKKLVAESELRRREALERCQTYQAARSQYAVSDIPLPDTNDIPMPELESPQELVPPGPPPGPPPENLLAVLARPSRVLPAAVVKPSKSVRFAPEGADQQPPPPPKGLPPHPLFIAPMPPGPPPGPPPNKEGFHSGGGTQPQPHIQSQPVLNTGMSGATISAQPQIRNIQAEVTKFMPTSLKVRRDQPKSSKTKTFKGQLHNTSGPSSGRSTHGTSGGDAYETFMKEMSGLL